MYVPGYAAKVGKQFLGYAISRRGGGFEFSQPQLIATDTGLFPVDDPSTVVIESDLPVQFETRRLAAGDINHDGLDDLVILDLNAADVTACADLGDPTIYRRTCTIHFDLLAGVSTGSEFNFNRIGTPWLRNDYINAFPNSIAAVDLNGDGRADFVNLAGPSTAEGSQTLFRIAWASRRR